MATEVKIHHLFEDQIIKTPNATAVRLGETSCTYAEFDVLAEQFSQHIVSLAPDAKFIGISSTRSIHTIAALFGILKAGKAYIPLDPQFPEARLQAIISESGISLCLSELEQFPIFESLVETVLVINNSAAPLPSGTKPIQTDSDLAYAIYTSGSTGKPKGVCVEHKSIINLINYHHKLSPYLAEGAATLQFSPLEFDVSVMEIFCTLCVGGTLVLVTEQLRIDPAALLEYIDKQQIQRLSLPFVSLQYLTAAALENNYFPQSIKEVITAGEQLKITPQIVAFFEALPECVFYNMYGPTEASVFTTILKLEGEPSKWPGKPSIGRPIDGVEVHVLNTDLIEVADGETGELCISGVNIAIGYLDNPLLTDQSFVIWTDRFGRQKRIYKSGDLCSKSPDGNISFLGRKDDQVKIRGNRVELAEIEVILNQIEGIKQAVVIVKPDPFGENMLVAYLIASSANIEAGLLKEQASGHLPEFMMPSHYVWLDDFPKTTSGKIDRNALPPILTKRPALSSLYSNPQTEIEQQLAGLWSELLSIDKIGRNDNFFELGGNSLLAIKLVSMLKLKHQLQLPVIKIYQYPSVSGLANFLSGEDEKLLPLTTAQRRTTGGEIAVIGMSLRVPGAETIETFWDVLTSGRETISFFSNEELDPAIPDQTKEKDNYVKARGVIENAAGFDAAFFGITPRIAELMDPQHRVFLELAWEALETTGHLPEKYKGLIGVFAGAGNNTYYTHNVLSNPERVNSAGSFLVSTLNEKDYLATRVAYELNLNGPAVSIQAASATSLVAIVQAVESLRSGQSDIALAGGISITSPVKSGHLYEDGAMLSADGHSRTFDENANGTVFSDGAGIVVLKRLVDAEKDGDKIYAVVKGIGLNNDGHAKGSFTAPSAAGQATAIAMAIEDAKVDPRTITYIEAHGTATPLGDPIEMAGLNMAFGNQKENQFCAIGSIKTNMGHLVAAAGVAGFIKAVLALHHKQIPASLFYNNPNPNIDFIESPFYVNTELADWQPGIIRRAGVSSFGVGGTNAHALLEEYIDANESVENLLPLTLFCLSAKSQTSLNAYRNKLLNYLESSGSANLPAIANTLNANFAQHPFRTIFTASDLIGLKESLKDLPQDSGHLKTLNKKASSLVFMFPGQGAQYTDMGSELYHAEPVFRDAIEECLKNLPGTSYEELLKINGTDTQPAIFVTCYALSKLWMSWGIIPDVLVGHSIGEFVAAHLAGVFSLADALKLVSNRAKLVAEVAPGSMLAVRLGEQELNAILPIGLDIAAINSHKLCVVSGSTPLINDFAESLTQQKIASGILQTSHAFHSRMMEDVVGIFDEVVKEVKLNAPNLPIVSTVTGTWLTAEQATDHHYWADHLRKPVRFNQAINQLTEDQDRVYLEVGPGRTLATLVLQQKQGNYLGVVAGIGEYKKHSEYRSLIHSAGQLWLNGLSPDWEAFYKVKHTNKLRLPGYAFDHQNYWLEPGSVSYASVAPAPHIRLIDNAKSDLNDQLNHSLIAIFEDVSGIDLNILPLDITFPEAGFDSLILTQIASTIKSKFGVPITFRKLFTDYNTIQKLAEFLSSNSSEAVTPEPIRQISAVNLSPEEIEESKKPFGATAKIERNTQQLQPSQQQFVDNLTVKYNAKTSLSKAKTQEDRAHMADPRVVSGFRPMTKELVYPIIVDRSTGCMLHDIDGNVYIDALNGFGSNLLGYQPDFIKKVLHEQIDKGYEIGPQHELAGEVCKLINEFTGFERSALCNTGSEAVLGTMRIARSITGRSIIVAFSGSYHGIMDEVIVRGTKSLRTVPAASGILPDNVQNMLILDYGTEESLKIIKERAFEIAAVLVEPVQSRRPDFVPVEFLKALRIVTEEHKIALIFDEVITGFRMHPGGAQALFGVKADLATYGKVIGGGISIGVIAGISAYMDALDGGFWNYGDESVPEVGVTYFAGTFVRHPLALATAKGTLLHLKEKGPSLQDKLNVVTTQMADRMREFCISKNIPVTVVNFGSLWRIKFAEDLPYSELLFTLMRFKGVHILDGFPCFMTTAHKQNDVETIFNVFCESIAELKEAGFLSRPEDSIRMVPATEPQLEIWTSCRIGGDAANCAYNDSTSLLLTGELDIPSMIKALTALTERHEALRTVFSADGQTLIISPKAEVDIDQHDISDKDVHDQEEFINDYALQIASTPIDLTTGPLYKFSLFKLAENKHYLTLLIHHIVCDGWSVGIILQDLGSLYTAISGGYSPNLPDAIKFSDYAIAEDNQSGSGDSLLNETFWLKQFQGKPPVMDLPTDNPRPVLRTYKSDRADFRLDETLTSSLKLLAQKQGASFVTCLVTAFELFLQQQTGQDQVVIGLPAAGQVATGNNRLVGHCMNLLAIKSEPDKNTSFSDYLHKRSSELLEVYDHQQYTFGKLLKKLSIPRDASRLPLVPIVFNIELGMNEGIAFRDLQFEYISNPRTFETFEIFLNLTDHHGGLTFEWSYNTRLFEASTIRKMMADLEAVFLQITTNSNLLIRDLARSGKTEFLQKLSNINSTAVSFPKHLPLHSLIEEVVLRDGSRTALKFKQISYSYSEMQLLSDQMAALLVRSGVNHHDLVGVAVERSAEMIIALLAIMKCGAAFVPLDPGLPVARVNYMLQDCGAKFLICSNNNTGIYEFGGKAFILETAIEEAKVLEDFAAVTVKGEDLLYILYTSGSTGKPKGVKVTHHNVVNLLLSMQQHPGISEADRLLAITTVSFDISILELFLPLISGAQVIIADADEARDGRLLSDLITTESITVMQATPSTWRMLLDTGWQGNTSLKAICGGEALSSELADKLLLNVGSLWNVYGPTETTIWSTLKAIAPDFKSITIGKPIANTTVYILDKYLRMVGEGTEGELYIGGAGVAAGYVNLPDLTSEKFVTDPFSGLSGARMYRTGDLAKFDAEGDVVYLSRIDSQVKIRGFRIETGEIEHEMLKITDIKKAVVLATPDHRGINKLIGYFVQDDAVLEGKALSSIDIKKQLALSIPDYMIPDQLVRVDKIPLTANGKVDRKALISHDEFIRDQNYGHAAPRTDVEKMVADIWSEVLGNQNISIYDNFFELGGHSLTAVQVMSKIEKQTGQRLPLATLFEHSTIEELSLLLNLDGKSVTWDSLVPIKPKGNKIPIYIVHGAGLNVLLFNTLAAHMDSDQPVYGLQAKGLNGIDEPLQRIEDMAAHYIAAIRAQNPNGPYALAGYSFGGVIAFEMARQLEAIGLEVKMLGMFDTYAYRTPHYDPIVIKYVNKGLYFGRKLWHTLTFKEGFLNTISNRYETFNQKMNHVLSKMFKGEKYDQLGAFGYPAKVDEMNSIASKHYRITPYNISIELFRADTRSFYIDDFEYMGWKTYALKGITVHNIPGEHNTIFKAPNDKYFAATLQDCLNKINT
ncbi:MAG: amino acid adenylation domain-containing protein [Bacteroidota bacterium]